MSELWHYTSFYAMCNILQKKHLCFWGTRFDSMNDPTEMKYAENIVLPVLKKSIKDTEYEKDMEEDPKVYPYIVSFSKSKDSFDMWRLYKSEVALVIDRKYLKKVQTPNHPAIVKDVSYASNEKELQTKATRLFNDATQSDNIIDTFRMSVFPFIKNVAYQVEKEVRMVGEDFDGATASYNGGDFKIEDKEEVRNGVMCHGVRNGRLLFHKEFIVPKKALQKIVIHTHSKDYFEEVSNSLKEYLKEKGYDVPIEPTKSYEFIG